jgi:hypothetical protein
MSDADTFALMDIGAHEVCDIDSGCGKSGCPYNYHQDSYMCRCDYCIAEAEEYEEE